MTGGRFDGKFCRPRGVRGVGGGFLDGEFLGGELGEFLANEFLALTIFSKLLIGEFWLGDRDGVLGGKLGTLLF